MVGKPRCLYHIITHVINIGVLDNETVVELIIATVYCSGDYITEFITISPLYMQKSAINPVSGTTNQWYITLTWTPTADQKGPQVTLSTLP